MEYKFEKEKITDLIERVLLYGEMASTTRPYTQYEKIGRVFVMYGVTSQTAKGMDYLAKESKTTLLCLQKFHFKQDISRMKAVQLTWKDHLSSVPFYQARDYKRFPIVTIEKFPDVREEYLPLELLEQCIFGTPKELKIDLVRLGYEIHDITLTGLATIIKSLEVMWDDEQKLSSDPNLRTKRWNLMMKRYQENEWLTDKQVFQKKLDEYIHQFGNDKTTLEMFLKQLDRDATDLLSIEMLVTLNRLYLNGEDHLSYIFEHRHELKQEHITRHLCFISCRKLVEQEIELYDLRQPAAGADADLFTCRAAKELVELLIPVITDRVDFDYSYQYAAWVKAMVDLKLIYPPKNNRMLITNYVNKKFKEKLDKSTLFRYFNKDEGVEKFKKQYELIMQIYDHTQDKRLDFLKKAL